MIIPRNIEISLGKFWETMGVLATLPMDFFDICNYMQLYRYDMMRYEIYVDEL